MNSLEKYIQSELDLYLFLKNPSPIVNHYPENIYIEVTNKCNLNCLPCSRKYLTRTKQNMLLSDFQIIINKLKNEDWIVPITLCGLGEPLLNHELLDMIKYAKKFNFNVSLISNSTLLTEDLTFQLLTSGLDRYSTMFDSIDKIEFETFRKGAKYDSTLDNILNLIYKNEELGHPVWISLGSIKSEMISKELETKQFWKDFPIDNYYNSTLLSLHTDSGLYEEAMKQAFGKKRFICLDPFFNLNIAVNGDCQLCATDCNYRWITGNIFNNSLDEIWNGNKAQELRRALLEWDIDFFKKNNHRCDLCNVPYIEEFTLENHHKYIAGRMARKLKWFCNELKTN